MIVDIRKVQSHSQAARYLTKYVSKIPELDDLDNPDYRYAELFLALYNGHLLIKFGHLPTTTPETETYEPSASVWKPVCGLLELLNEARSGSQDAWKILAQLTPRKPDWLRRNVLNSSPCTHSPPGEPEPCLF
jgi:hypothetical protein